MQPATLVFYLEGGVLFFFELAAVGAGAGTAVCPAVKNLQGQAYPSSSSAPR